MWAFNITQVLLVIISSKLALASIPESKDLLHVESANSGADVIQKQIEGLKNRLGRRPNRFLPADEAVDDGTTISQTAPRPVSLAAYPNYRPYYPIAKSNFQPTSSMQTVSPSLDDCNLRNPQHNPTMEPAFVRLVGFQQPQPVTYILAKNSEPMLHSAWYQDGILVSGPLRDWELAILPPSFLPSQHLRRPHTAKGELEQVQEKECVAKAGELTENNSPNEKTLSITKSALGAESSFLLSNKNAPDLKPNSSNEKTASTTVSPNDLPTHSPSERKTDQQMKESSSQTVLIVHELMVVRFRSDFYTPINILVIWFFDGASAQALAESTLKISEKDDQNSLKTPLKATASQKPSFATVLRKNKAPEPELEKNAAAETAPTGKLQIKESCGEVDSCLLFSGKEKPYIPKVNGQERIPIEMDTTWQKIIPKKKKILSEIAKQSPKLGQKKAFEKPQSGFITQATEKTIPKVNLSLRKDGSAPKMKPIESSFHQRTKVKEYAWCEVSHRKKKSGPSALATSVPKATTPSTPFVLKATTNSAPFEILGKLFSESEELDLKKSPSEKNFDNMSKAGVHENEEVLQMSETNEAHEESLTDIIQDAENSKPTPSGSFSEEKKMDESTRTKKWKKKRKKLSGKIEEPSEDPNDQSLPKRVGVTDSEITPAAQSHEKISHNLPFEVSLEVKSKPEPSKSTTETNFHEKKKSPTNMLPDFLLLSQEVMPKDEGLSSKGNWIYNKLEDVFHRSFEPWASFDLEKDISEVFRLHYESLATEISKNKINSFNLEKFLLNHLKVKDKSNNLLLENLNMSILKILRQKWKSKSEDLILVLMQFLHTFKNPAEAHRRIDRFSRQILQYNLSENWPPMQKAFLKKGKILTTDVEEMEAVFQVSRISPDLHATSKLLRDDAMMERLENMSVVKLAILAALMGLRDIKVRFSTIEFLRREQEFLQGWKQTNLFDAVINLNLNPFKILTIGKALNLGSNAFPTGSADSKEVSDKFGLLAENLLADDEQLVPWFESPERAWLLQNFKAQYESRLPRLCSYFREVSPRKIKFLNKELEEETLPQSKYSLKIHQVDHILWFDKGLETSLMIQLFASSRDKGVNSKEKWRRFVNSKNLSLTTDQKTAVVDWFAAYEAKINA
ncbi:hypothetical protein O181_022807 [Austropuccinia psidii MF-1]|uniref:Uncharacterized protein n=1 Tax=Austropuccinia psidii MF-1 TaxID=1389203 RepID=A0A9Q3CIB1_9BASI|nr:hypothetical protein [Austropuccinia psidii MF-1]